MAKQPQKSKSFSIEDILSFIDALDANSKAIVSHWVLSDDTTDSREYKKHAKAILAIEKFNAIKAILADKIKSAKLRNGFSVRFPHQENAHFRFIDLFAGIGGFRVAMQANGGRCVFSSEWNEAAQKTYAYNFGETPFGDITLASTKELIPEKFDVLCAGFPCQAFSIAGYQKGFEDTRGTLFFDVAKILEMRRPRAFYLENVKNLKAHDNGRTFRTIKKVLEDDLGYRTFDHVMSPDEYANVPQNRERIFIVGFDPKQVNEDAIDSFVFPDRVPLTRTIADCIDQNVTDNEFFYTRKYGCYDAVNNGVIRTDTVYQWRRQYVRENKSNVCPTLTANMGAGGHNVPLIRVRNGVRKLTPRECLNFQGFPPEYVFPKIASSKCYMQAGNSVTVPLITRVANEIVRVLNA